MGEFPDLPDIESREDSDGYSRLIAVVIVFTTLLAAATALLQAEALRRDDEAAVRAERLTAQSLGARVKAQSGAELQYQRFQLAETQRRRASNARQLALFANTNTREQQLAEARWTRVADRTDEGTSRMAKQLGFAPITAGAADGPEKDPAFPNRYNRRYERDSIYLDALKDGANAEGDRAEEQFTSYAVSLTLFAVAVFLLGYSLTPAGARQRRLFAFTAGAFVSAGAIFAAVTAIDGPERKPDEAAAAFADGATAAATLDYESAIRRYDRAIDLRDDYARAYADRASARTALNSPNPNFVSITGDTDSIEQNVDDLEKAVELDEDSAPYKLSLASNLFLLGIFEGDDGKLEEALDLTREGKVAFEASPFGEYNEAATLLALGRTDEAEEAYDRAIEKTLYLDVEKKEKRDNTVQRAQFVSGAFTDLELILHAKGDEVDDDVRAIKERIITPLSADALPPYAAGTKGGAAVDQASRREAPPARLHDVAVTPSPATVEWVAGEAEHLDLEKDRVYTVWYHENPLTHSWAAEPPVTGEAAQEEINVTADGENFLRRSYLAGTNPPTCMPEGKWRAEIYVNGRFAGGGVGATRFPELKTAQARDLAMATCIPPDWQLSENQLPGLVRGWTNKEGTQGAYLWVINEGILDTGDQSEARAKEVLDSVLPAFEFTLPSPPMQGESNPAPFMGLAGETVKTYSLKGGGGMLAGIGFTEDGETVVAYAFGDFDENENFYVGEAVDRVFESISQY
jgi:tetratricopeptide (TPR) repeat protein